MQRAVTTTLVALALAATGCGSGDGLPRQPLAGVVTIDGLPLPTGMITFTPTAAAEPVVSAVVVAGAFRIEQADGPIPGEHKVSIWGKKPTGKKVRNPDAPDELIDELVEVVPEHYNFNSTLTYDVQEGGAGSGATFPLSGAGLAKGKGRRVRR